MHVLDVSTRGEGGSVGRQDKNPCLFAQLCLFNGMNDFVREILLGKSVANIVPRKHEMCDAVFDAKPDISVIHCEAPLCLIDARE